jgi:hypothetical protein
MGGLDEMEATFFAPAKARKQSRIEPMHTVYSMLTSRGAQTAVFKLDIRISNPLYIDVCQSLASGAGLKSRNVEKRINAV